METHKNIVLGFIISFLHLLSESRRRSQFRNWILKIIKTVSASSFSYFPEVLLVSFSIKKTYLKEDKN